MEYAQFISDVLLGASRIALERFGKVTNITKADDNNQVLTQADLDIGKCIIGKIRDEFSGYNIIDEEAGAVDRQSDFTWVIDPIDGTSNFASGLPTYGIMLGLLKCDVPVAGGVMLPYFRELYLAEKGRGATLNGVPIHVTGETDLSKTLVSFGIDNFIGERKRNDENYLMLSALATRTRNVRSSNSCFDIMHVASGSYALWLGTESRIWDNVAPQVIIEEAGGIHADLYGKPMDYTDPLHKIEMNYTVCSAPAKLYSEIQRILHS